MWLNNSSTGKFTLLAVCDPEIEYAGAKGLNVSGQKLLVVLFRVSTVVFAIGQRN